MNKTLIIGLVVGVAAIGGIFVMFNSGTNSQDAGSGAAMEDKSFSGTMSEVIASGQDVTCTFEQQESGAVVQGTVYLAAKGEKVRGDFVVQQQEQSMTGSVIRKDGTNYSWGETPFGSFATKVAVDAKSEKGEGFDIDNENIAYTCSSWRVDESKFALPSGVSFDDINAEVMQINAATQQVTDLQCNACNQIPDANAQAQCKAALGC